MTDIAELPIRPGSADAGLDQVLHPGLFYDRPADVAADTELTLDERRAILSFWASDACAVESVPALRQPPFAREPVSFDEIMDALLQLDRHCVQGVRKSSDAGRPRFNRCDEAICV
jgi:hypothetical protein